MSFRPNQIAELSAKLDGSNVKTRSQSGRNLSYIESWVAISEANRIFGFDGWSSEVLDLKVTNEGPTKIGQSGKEGWRVGYMARVRVTVTADGRTIIRDGCGWGSGIDVDLGAAHESALKEAESDSRKRALMTFGNPFGLALYDKTQENVDREPHKPAQPDSKPVQRNEPAKPAEPAATPFDEPRTNNGSTSGSQGASRTGGQGAGSKDAGTGEPVISRGENDPMFVPVQKGGKGMDWKRWCDDVVSIAKTLRNNAEFDKLGYENRVAFGNLKRADSGLYEGIGLELSSMKTELERQAARMQ